MNDFEPDYFFTFKVEKKQTEVKIIYYRLFLSL
jgi:hypothetical protein